MGSCRDVQKVSQETSLTLPSGHVQIAGVIFPVPILLLIPIREFILPRLFGRKNLAALDPAPYEDEEGRPLRSQARAQEGAAPQEGERGEVVSASGGDVVSANGNQGSLAASPRERRRSRDVELADQ